jgi:type IV fimbrial biogenesis protein FimT
MFRPACLDGGGERGLTLIELLITVAILSLLTAIGVPGVMGLIRDARLSTNTDMLINTINSARVEAVKRRANITVCPVADPGSDSACVADATLWSRGAIVLDGTTVIQRVVFGTGVTVTTTATSIDINATLASAGAATTFTLCSTGRRQQEVELQLSGSIKKTLATTVCS